MYTLKQIYEEVERHAKVAEAAKDWFMGAWDVEDHVLPRQLTELFGSPALAREWMFTTQGKDGECQALWVVQGKRQKVIDSLERTSNGFVG